MAYNPSTDDQIEVIEPTLNAAELAELASDLRSAEVDCAPIGRLSDRYPCMTVVDSYEVQLLNIRAREEAGTVVRGHKIGLSSRAMQIMMGVDEPDYGHLLSDMFVPEHVPIQASKLCAPRVEVEIAFVLQETLPGIGCTIADVLRCTDYIVPALEIIDSRIQNWDIGLVDTIADNASSGLVVLGSARTDPSSVDLRTVGAVLRKDGDIIATGASGAVLGNPAAAVAWLANKVHSFGVRLEKGHVILPGSCTRAYDVAAGETVRADFDVLGSVTTTFK
ncbi:MULTISPECIES: 2-keto-4-pentenoate hydratase [unclassified Nocardioides]|uniref:2-keto-4-pentenoate hydratase n=1 Tax=unclassified Nocardioides TaxID=2615069 RepID=UPI0006F41029|nr:MULTISPECIES: 2-keto-4-pentenoate hydratase [unclassified Nocardioides]KRA31506.1 2-keto-4-pentenoate hydratase [Nocardioides sp. Root614]KRA88421.1 2-keto-4-pentenoate hydratase [Nocardioides sp. Root682]